MVDWFESGSRRFILVVPNPTGMCDPHRLTKRETEVATYAVLGETGKLIGFRLGLSTSRVSSVLHDAMRKLRVRTQAELVAKLRPLGLQRGGRRHADRLDLHVRTDVPLRRVARLARSQRSVQWSRGHKRSKAPQRDARLSGALL